MLIQRSLVAFAALAAVVGSAVFGLEAASASLQPGPEQISTAEYKFPASVDDEILKDRETELWARAFWPNRVKGKRLPILFLLHGNHQTCGSGSRPRLDTDCSYTMSGACPSGKTVVPNHEGYRYLAEHLASHGYIVVSINANRGITCGFGDSEDYGLVLARGRLVLRHMELWSQWNSAGGAPRELGEGPDGFVGAVDFAHMGLFGHSRGGEGVRAAYNLLIEPNSPWKIRVPNARVRAIYEIGATDGLSSRTLDALGTAWNQVLPMCDGDVSDFSGRLPFERMILAKDEDEAAPKSLYMVWGANHNFFNSEWHANDSVGCHNHEALFQPQDFESERQRQVALASLSDFFRAHVGSAARPSLARHFNPAYPLPAAVLSVAQVDRDMTSTVDDLLSVTVEDFKQPTGKSAWGESNLASQVEVDHQPQYNGSASRARVAWTQPGFFQINWSKPGEARSIAGRATLDFRVSRIADAGNQEPQTDFSVQLVHADESVSMPVRALSFGSIRGPVSVTTLYQTVRIPVAAFSDPRLDDVRGIRFVFDRTPNGAIYLANVRFSSLLNSDGEAGVRLQLTRNIDIEGRNWGLSGAGSWKVSRLSNRASRNALVQSARVLEHRRVPASVQLSGRPAVEIRVAAQGRFPVRDDLPVLMIGEKRILASRFPENGHTGQLIFSIPIEDYATLEDQSPMRIEYGRKASLVYLLSPLEKQ